MWFTVLFLVQLLIFRKINYSRVREIMNDGGVNSRRPSNLPRYVHGTHPIHKHKY